MLNHCVCSEISAVKRISTVLAYTEISQNFSQYILLLGENALQYCLGKKHFSLSFWETCYFLRGHPIRPY